MIDLNTMQHYFGKLSTIYDYETARSNPVLGEITSQFITQLDLTFKGQPWYINYLSEAHDRFLLAPASGQKKFHGAWQGGLAAHSALIWMMATMNAQLMKLHLKLNVQYEWVEILLLQGALFHDLGKIGDLTANPFYVDEPSKWHRDNMGRLYNTTPAFQGLTHEDLSMKWVNHLGVSLDNTLLLMVLHHDAYREIRGNGPAQYSQDAVYKLFSFVDDYIVKVFLV